MKSYMGSNKRCCDSFNLLSSSPIAFPFDVLLPLEGLGDFLAGDLEPTESPMPLSSSNSDVVLPVLTSSGYKLSFRTKKAGAGVLMCLIFFLPSARFVIRAKQ